MERKLRTKVPTNAANLVPREVPLSQLRNTDEEIRKKQKGNYNKRHRSRDLAPLKEGDSVFLLDRREHGHVLRKAKESRSYYIATDSGTFRRNRHNIITVQGVESDSVEDDFLPVREDPEAPIPPALHPGEPPPPARPLRTRSGRQVQCPARLDL